MNKNYGSAPVWLFNGIPAPIPMGQLKIVGSQLVDSKRNGRAEVVAQKINRRMRKYDSVQWSYLTYDQWQWIVRNVENFEVNLTFWDEYENRIITRRFYFGDASATPYEWDSVSYTVAKPLSYINCTVNIIDMGY